MAFIISRDALSGWIDDNIHFDGGTIKEVVVDDVNYMDIYEWPKQEGIPQGVLIAALSKEFCEYGKEMGKGGITVAKLKEKFGEQIPEALLPKIAREFDLAFGNMMIVPPTSVITITADPFNSILDLIHMDEPHM